MPSKAITVKERIFCTISGFIRYVSGAYLGPSTDKFITGTLVSQQNLPLIFQFYLIEDLMYRN